MGTGYLVNVIISHLISIRKRSLHMRSIRYAFFLGLMMLMPSVARADFPLICRGGSLYKYDTEIKKAVKAKLDAANIPFKRVAVDYVQVKRPRSTFVNDFESDITLNSGSAPSVSFTGAFPEGRPCTISFKLKILVVYADGTRATTLTTATAPGTLLPPLAPNREAGDE